MATTTKLKAEPTVIPPLTATAKKPPAANKTKLPAMKPAAGKAALAATVPARAAPKPAAKSAVKTISKALGKALSKASAGKIAKPKEAKPVKPKKPKLVRDSFTIPKAEYTVLDDLKQRAARLASPAKKSELLRAGIKALAAMPDAAFVAALGAVPAIKTGRPSKA